MLGNSSTSLTIIEVWFFVGEGGVVVVLAFGVYVFAVGVCVLFM